MSVEDDYNFTLKEVKKILAQKKIINNPADYVNQAWLTLSESNKPFTWNLVLKKSKAIILEEVRQNTCFNTRATTKVCNCCHEDLPVAMFLQKWVKRLSRYVTDYICKPCKYKKNTKWIRGNLVKYKQYSQSYRDRLPDSYIIINLRKQGIKNPSKQEVIDCRERLTKKRERIKNSRTV